MKLTHHRKEIKFAIIFFTILMIVLIGINIFNSTDKTKLAEQQKSQLFGTLDKNTNVNVSKYSIYGTHLNIEGTLDVIKISGIKIDYVDLILKNLDGEEIVIKSDFSYSDNILAFTTSDEINEGIDLENMELGNYYILLKVTYSNSDIKYYSLINSSEYIETAYYTITKDNLNRKITLSFDTYNEIPYMTINTLQIDTLPENIYDIAIDLGTLSNKSDENDLILNCGLELKTKLEDLGLKVFISRDNNEKKDTESNMYDETGRINLLNASNAKLLISLTLGSNKYSKENGGVEIYAPSNCNLEFARLLAKNVVEKSGSYYSKLNSFKKDERCIC